MSRSTYSMPQVLAPNGSDVSQAELDHALAALIVEKIHDESIKLQRIGRELQTLGADLENDDALANDRLAHALKIVAGLGDQLTTASQALERRSEALITARGDAIAAANECQSHTLPL